MEVSVLAIRSLLHRIMGCGPLYLFFPLAAIFLFGQPWNPWDWGSILPPMYSKFKQFKKIEHLFKFLRFMEIFENF